MYIVLIDSSRKTVERIDTWNYRPGVFLVHSHHQLCFFSMNLCNVLWYFNTEFHDDV
jgi:hypothetical protein